MGQIKFSLGRTNKTTTALVNRKLTQKVLGTENFTTPSMATGYEWSKSETSYRLKPVLSM